MKQPALLKKLKHSIKVIFWQLQNYEISDRVEDILTLTLEEKISLEGEITLNEAGLALKNMKNNKRSGSDGFTVE